METYKTMNEHIDDALTTFRLQAARYARPTRYYDGSHDLAFATDKFKNTFGTLFREFALNLCPAICDALRDKMRVTGFSVDTGKSVSPSDLKRIWNDNRMRTRAGELHKEAFICGDAYMIVWPNAAGEAVLYPNRAASCSVVYDDEQPGRIVRAAKHWLDADKRLRLNLFYPDRIEKFVSTKPSDIAAADCKTFVPAGDASVVPNPFGLVPVFHFANNADLGCPGRSELAAAIPIQDGLNKSVLDMLVAMEYSAFRQRWAAGIEIEYDNSGKPIMPFAAGVEHLWLAQNADAKFGDFETADLVQFLKVKDNFRIDMALVTGTPLHYLTPNIVASRTSESVRRSESRFLAKVRDRQESFGQVWADVMSFALVTEGRGRDIRLITEWEDPAPLSDREFLENILLKKQIGLTTDQALIEAGYGIADIRKMIGNIEAGTLNGEPPAEAL